MQFKLFFGDFDSVAANCIRKDINFTDVVHDEIIQCQKVSEKKCYTSQETVFETYTVRWILLN